jgi:hypothetical protein
MLLAEASGFPWEAVTALGTLALAAGTFILALTTRSLARATRDDLRAQWRPALIPALDPQADRAVTYDQQAHVLFVRIRNGGRGSAHHIRTHLDPGGVSPENWSLGSLPAGEEVTLRFNGVHGLSSSAQVLLDYRDLAENAYSSALVLTEVNADWRFYDVHLWEGHSVTDLGDAVYPQPGLTDARPSPI